MNLTALNFTIVLLLIGAAPVALSVEREQIDNIFSDYDTTHSPGCSMAVYEQGDIVLSRGYGMANLEYGIANRSSTVFRIASASKQFTAMTIALLAEQGKLSLDDDIHKFFPDMPDYGQPITVRQLVHHTSGLRDYVTLTWLADWSADPSVEETLGIVLRQRELNFPPGSDYLYSNTGYFLLSQIVEIVTHQSLREWADANVFGPLRMHNTHFHDDHTHIVKNRADGYGKNKDGEYRISMTSLDNVGDGGVFTTVEDLLKWDRIFYENSLGAGDPKLIELAQTPGSLNNGEKHDYAFGLTVDEFQGTPEIWHDGSWDGFASSLHRYPDHHLSVAVLCNDEDSYPTKLARDVAKLYLGKRDTIEPDTGDRLEHADHEGGSEVDVSGDELGRFVGDYIGPDALMVRSIAMLDGSLFYIRFGGGRYRLDPRGSGRFISEDRPYTVRIRFEPAASIANSMIVEVEGEEPVRLTRFNRFAPNAEQLKDFAGSYYSAELDHVQQLTVNGDSLAAMRRVGPTPLEPLQQDSFISRADVVLEFRRGTDGNISGFVMQADRVRNLQFTRQ